MISLACDFSVEKENFEIHMCFMVIKEKYFYSGGIKDSDYCFENQLFFPQQWTKIEK